MTPLEEVKPHVKTFVRICHAVVDHRDDAPRYAEPSTIARVAGKMVKTFYAHEFVGDGSDRVTRAELAGYLVYAMELYGLNFEAVCHEAEQSIAKVVSGLSPDNTLPNGPRRDFLRSKLGEADAITQCVKLAEIHCVARQMLDGLTATAIALHGDTIDRWADEATGYLEVLKHIHKNPSMKEVLKQIAGEVKRVGGLTAAAAKAAKVAAGEVARARAAVAAVAAEAEAAAAEVPPRAVVTSKVRKGRGETAAAPSRILVARRR